MLRASNIYVIRNVCHLRGLVQLVHCDVPLSAATNCSDGCEVFFFFFPAKTLNNRLTECRW